MRKMLKGFTVLIILFFSVTFTGVWAAEKADNPDSKNQGVFSLGEVVVTGEANQEVTTTDVVDQDQIRLTNSKNVSDALDTLPGLFINVGTKNERNFILRGFNERYVPVFFDGIPIYVPNDGYVDTGKLPTGGISRITVTKGVSSVLYGPNTMGGVINVVTKKPEKPLEGEISTEYSEENAWRTNLNVGSRMDRFYFMLSGGLLNSDGYRLSDDFKPSANEDGNTRDNTDIDQWNGNVKVGFTPKEGQEFAFGVNHVRSEWGLPPDAYTERPRFWRFTDWEKTTYYVIGDSTLTDKLTAKIRVYHDTYYNVLDSYDDNTYSTQTRRYAFHSTYDDYTNGGSLTLTSTHILRNSLAFAFHYKQDVHREQDDYEADWERYETRYYSFGLEDTLKLTDTLSAVVGAAYDLQKPEYANGETVRDSDNSLGPMAGITWSVLEGTDVYASVGKKTRFPTLMELYSSYLDQDLLPNPDLEKEEAVNYDVGIRHRLPFNSVLEFNVYYSDLKNLIATKAVAPDVDQKVNIDKARYQGFEFNLGTKFLPHNDLNLSYTYLDAENRSSDRTSDYLEERPKHKLYVSDLFEVNEWVSLFGKVSWYSKQYYEDWDTGEWKTLSGFVTADAKVMVTLKKYLTLEGGVKNIFDENYELSPGYPREGRTFFAGMRVVF
jgi:iron complex outermembrane receptor protein